MANRTTIRKPDSFFIAHPGEETGRDSMCSATEPKRRRCLDLATTPRHWRVTHQLGAFAQKIRDLYPAHDIDSDTVRGRRARAGPRRPQAGTGPVDSRTSIVAGTISAPCSGDSSLP